MFDDECDETRDGENDEEEEEEEDDEDEGSRASDGEEDGDDCNDDEDEFVDEEDEEDNERARLANLHKRKSNSDPSRDRLNRASDENHSSNSNSNGRSKMLGKNKLRKGCVTDGDGDDEIDWDDDKDVIVGAAVRVDVRASNGGSRARSSHHRENNFDGDSNGDIVWDAEGGSPKFQPRRAPGDIHSNTPL